MRFKKFTLAPGCRIEEIPAGNEKCSRCGTAGHGTMIEQQIPTPDDPEWEYNWVLFCGTCGEELGLIERSEK